MLDCKNGIIGLAIGDAMGVPIEFVSREILIENPLTEMIGEQSHNMPKGCWSDDTSLNLALMDAINNNEGNINLQIVGYNFIDWAEHSKYTPTGIAFGIGMTTFKSIAKLEYGDRPPEDCGGKQEKDNGNGSLMRILPIAYYCYGKKLNDEETYELVKNVSSLTHGHEISIMGCYIYVKYAMELLDGKDLKEAYKNIQKLKYPYFSDYCKDKYKRILKSDISKLDIDEINSTGFVVDTLEAALWSLLNTENYNQAIIGSINLGGDSDTIGACTGGLAGIHYGIDSIRKEWKEDLVKYDYIEEICNRFNDVIN